MNTNRVIVRIVLLVILSMSYAYTQDSTMTDSLLSNQKLILKNQAKMMDEVIYEDPLAGKTYGVEFNPVGFLLSTTSDDGFSVAGSVSLFSVSEVAEIAFPFVYSTGSRDYLQFSVDSHYRYFLGKHRKGFYLSSGLRFTHIEGQEENPYYYWGTEPTNQVVSDNKLGLTFGIGYRKYGYNGWYWGMSLFGGRYFTAKVLNLYDGGLLDGKSIIDMELLKIGKMF